METLDLIFGGIALFASFIIMSIILIGLVSLGIQVAKNIRKSHEKHQAGWRRLAEATGLTFHPSPFQAEVKVEGRYRGHQVMLKVDMRGGSGKERSYTCLILEKFQDEGGANPDPSLKKFTANELADFLNSGQAGYLGGKIKATPGGSTLRYEAFGIETNPQKLQTCLEWMSEALEAYPAIVASGGESVATLVQTTRQNGALHRFTRQLLREIAADTENRLAEYARYLFCPNCLTCCGEHEVSLGWLQEITFFGCRTCRQSRGFYEANAVVVVLDNAMPEAIYKQVDTLYVNWFTRLAPFDFDRVDIRQATDEEVERFAVQVGNDTEVARNLRYPNMACRIDPLCNLSQNTRRILQRTFGSLEG